MSTINKAIERASLLRPDAVEDSIKARWISELDGRIAAETMHIDGFCSYEFPADCEKELLVRAPFDSIYELYIIAMSDFLSGELGSYSASAAMFDSAFDEFRKNYIRKHMPPSADFVL